MAAIGWAAYWARQQMGRFIIKRDAALGRLCPTQRRSVSFFHCARGRFPRRQFTNGLEWTCREGAPRGCSTVVISLGSRCQRTGQALVDGLREHGWEEGRNVVLEGRFAGPTRRASLSWRRSSSGSR